LLGRSGSSPAENCPAHRIGAKQADSIPLKKKAADGLLEYKFQEREL